MQAPPPESSHHPLSDTLVCRQKIPFRWNKLLDNIGESDLLKITVDNCRLVEVLLNSEDAHFESDQTVEKDTTKELRKIDAKLNLLMNWVGELMIQQQELPHPQAIQYSAKGLQFHTTIQLAVEDQLKVELFLEPRFPQAFIMLAKVIEVNPQQEGYEIVAVFSDIMEYNQQWFEKYIFRQHRRQVALSRKNPARP